MALGATQGRVQLDVIGKTLRFGARRPCRGRRSIVWPSALDCFSAVSNDADRSAYFRGYGGTARRGRAAGRLSTGAKSVEDQSDAYVSSKLKVEMDQIPREC